MGEETNAQEIGISCIPGPGSDPASLWNMMLQPPQGKQSLFDIWPV